MKRALIILSMAAIVLLVPVSVSGQIATPTAPPPAKPSPTAPVVPALTPLPTLPPAAPVAAATSAPANTPAPTPAEGINPLTGLPAEAPDALTRRPLLVKISNYPPVVRPQYALNWADHMWEYMMEGGSTRLTAVFLTHARRQIGSVRSARPIDAHLVPIYRGLLAYSGASTGTEAFLQSQPWYGEGERVFWQKEDCPMFCRYEIEGVDMWHTLFADAAAIWEGAAERGLDGPVDLQGLTFRAEPPPGGTPAKIVEIEYPATYAYWLYSPRADTYYRWTEGEEHHDAVGDVQVAYDNVVIIYAPHEETDIVEDEIGAGNYATDIQIVGEGAAAVFRSGQQYAARWVLPAGEGMFRLVNDGGDDIPLAPGKTWFHPLPPDFDNVYISN